MTPKLNERRNGLREKLACGVDLNLQSRREVAVALPDTQLIEKFKGRSYRSSDQRKRHTICVIILEYDVAVISFG